MRHYCPQTQVTRAPALNTELQRVLLPSSVFFCFVLFFPQGQGDVFTQNLSHPPFQTTRQIPEPQSSHSVRKPSFLGLCRTYSPGSSSQGHTTHPQVRQVSGVGVGGKPMRHKKEQKVGREQWTAPGKSQGQG